MATKREAVAVVETRGEYSDADRVHDLLEFSEQIDRANRESIITGTIIVSEVLEPLQCAVRLFPPKLAEGENPLLSATVRLLAALEAAVVRFGLSDGHEIIGGRMFGRE
jgi:hypothetical protein